MALHSFDAIVSHFRMLSIGWFHEFSISQRKYLQGWNLDGSRTGSGGNRRRFPTGAQLIVASIMYQSAFRILDICTHSSINLINLSWTTAGIVFWVHVLALNHIKQVIQDQLKWISWSFPFLHFLFTLRQRFKNGQNILWPMNLPLHSFCWCVLLQ